MTAVFVWERNSRGQWAPSLFHDGDDIPAAMHAKENARRYVMHRLADAQLWAALEADDPLAACAAQFPPPALEPPEPILVTIERSARDVD